MTIPTPQADATARGCVQRTDIFQDVLLEDPPTSLNAAERRATMKLTSQAAKICGACPLQNKCLYTAVVDHDVSGFVAGTTEKQRLKIRRALGWKVTPDNMDSLAGAFAQNRQVDHDEVVRLRMANPHESLEMLAHRMGCSLSTIKRHLRRHRQERTSPKPRQVKVKPSLRKVLTAAQQVLNPQTQRQAA